MVSRSILITENYAEFLYLSIPSYKLISTSSLTSQRLYDLGARNFWVHNTGPLGCLGQNIAKFGTDASKLDELGCVSSHNQAAKILNLQLYALCKKLQGQYSDANITHVDIFSIKSNLIANYSRNGKLLSFFTRNDKKEDYIMQFHMNLIERNCSTSTVFFI